ARASAIGSPEARAPRAAPRAPGLGGHPRVRPGGALRAEPGCNGLFHLGVSRSLARKYRARAHGTFARTPPRLISTGTRARARRAFRRGHVAAAATQGWNRSPFARALRPARCPLLLVQANEPAAVALWAELGHPAVLVPGRVRSQSELSSAAFFGASADLVSSLGRARSRSATRE